jgi:hypothetical protein
VVIGMVARTVWLHGFARYRGGDDDQDDRV